MPLTPKRNKRCSKFVGLFWAQNIYKYYPKLKLLTNGKLQSFCEFCMIMVHDSENYKCTVTARNKFLHKPFCMLIVKPNILMWSCTPENQRQMKTRGSLQCCPGASLQKINVISTSCASPMCHQQKKIHLLFTLDTYQTHACTLGMLSYPDLGIQVWVGHHALKIFFYIFPCFFSNLVIISHHATR